MAANFMVGPPTVGYNVCMSFEGDESAEFGDQQPREAEDQFDAYSINCTHLGCPVRWEAGAKLFLCPCHGGVYNIRGIVTGGPPVRPLDRFYTRVRGDRVENLVGLGQLVERAQSGKRLAGRHLLGSLLGSSIAHPLDAVAEGDLNQKITVDVKGEILELKNTINTMVDQLNAFAAEVTRVAREVGTEGKLGGQAQVPGVAGTWKDLTDNVNVMAANLTEQVRGIVKVVTAVANGDLKQNLLGKISEYLQDLSTYDNDWAFNLIRESGTPTLAG